MTAEKEKRKRSRALIDLQHKRSFLHFFFFEAFFAGRSEKV